MRTILSGILTLLLTPLAGCTCSPPTPVPITMRVVNASRDPVFLDDSQGRLGLQVQRDVLGTLYPFDDLACACTFCSNVCGGGCGCPDAGVALVRRLAAGGTAERAWDGVVQVSGTSTCGPGNRCTNPENAPTNESFDLRLCFSTQRPLGLGFDDAGVGVGQLPLVGRTCVDKRFAIQDGVVEIGPARGSDCNTSLDCHGPGELCFAGSCTAACPANDFHDWSLQLGSPADMGFFTRAPRASGFQLTGTGTLTSVVYTGESVRLSLSRPGVGSELLTAQLTLQFPPGVSVPLAVPSQVSVVLVDSGSTDIPNLGLVLREAGTGGLVLAADMARGGSALTPADTSPFALGSGTVPVGCRQDGCGKLLYYPRTLDAGVAGASVEPGARATLVLPQGTYTLLSVTDSAYATSTTCSVAEARPWMLWRTAAP